MNFEAAIINVSLLWLLTAPHEFAHAWVATKLGDDTPMREGRVTLNPLAHVDWIGTALLPAVTSLIGGGFLGWGKPVNTNPSRLRWGLNGLALVALAGPASNVIFAVILALAAVLAFRVAPAFSEYAAKGVQLSLYLAIFNLIPVPPLDGSRVVDGVVPYTWRRQWESIVRLSPVLLILLVVASQRFGIITGPANYVVNWLGDIISAIRTA